MREDSRRLLVEVLEMSGGPALWLLHLFAMYAASTYVCAGPLRGTPGDERWPLVSIPVTVLALGVSIWLLVRALRERAAGEEGEARAFVNRVTVALSLFAIVAILWTAAPLVTGPACEPAGYAASQPAREPLHMRPS